MHVLFNFRSYQVLLPQVYAALPLGFRLIEPHPSHPCFPFIYNKWGWEVLFLTRNLHIFFWIIPVFDESRWSVPGCGCAGPGTSRRAMLDQPPSICLILNNNECLQVFSLFFLYIFYFFLILRRRTKLSSLRSLPRGY